MAVSGSDIYISANFSTDAFSADQISEVWKNGNVKTLPKGLGISNVVVAEGNVYLASSDSAGTAQYWINDSVIPLSDGTGNSVNASCIFVSGQSVYVGANQAFPSVGWHPEYGLNSQVTTLPSPTRRDCWVSGIFVSNSEVCLCGYDNYYTAFWTNAGETPLAGGNSESRASSIYVSGNDIYAGGFDGNFVVYWKNGSEVFLADSTNPGYAAAIVA